MNSIEPQKNIAVIQYPSLGQWLADRLARAIATLDPMTPQPLDVIPLPLLAQSDHPLGTFASPLPLQWSRRGLASTAQGWGHDILQAFASQSETADFNPHVWLHPQGWLYAQFGADDLAQWLQQMTSATPTLQRPEQSPQAIDHSIHPEPILFGLQYAHARCCSLLRLAQREGRWGDLQSYCEPLGSSLWQTPGGEFRLQLPAERAILQQLLKFPQSLSPQKVLYGCPQSVQVGTHTRLEWPLPEVHLQKQAEIWSKGFSHFYRDCQLFGADQRTAPESVQARFALVHRMQTVLAFILEEVLQIKAPTVL